MSLEEIQRLIALLDETHASLHSLLSKNNLKLNVYSDPDWSFRDVICHITSWDLEVTRSIRAFINGDEYSIANLDEGDYNAEEIAKSRALTIQQVLQRNELARDDFKKAVRAVTEEKVSDDLLYPWGSESGSTSNLVEDMVEHDREHLAEIKAAIEASTGG